MGLYCLKCKRFAYRNHNSDCTIRDVIPITKDMRGIADRLHRLSFEMLSARCFKHPVTESLYEHTIIVDIEFRHEYSTTILWDMPKGWKWFTEVAGIGWPMMALSYSETFICLGFLSVEERIKEITDEFEAYLDTLDNDALRAIRLLMTC